jgi:uncharacterized protein YdaU (DUF1376 family)
VSAHEKKTTRRRIEDGRVLYFMWCPADLNAKTTHLTDEARSAYRELLDFAFLHGRDQTDLPDDDRYLMMAAKAKARNWDTIKFLLFECAKPMFIKTPDGWWRNPRLAEEVEIALEKSGQAAAAAHLRHGRDRITGDQRMNNDRTATALRPRSVRNANKKEKKIKKPQETTSPSVGERETTTAGARKGGMSVAAFTARCREVSDFLERYPKALQCLHCSPHPPHAPGACCELLRDTSRCDCAEEETRLDPVAARAFEDKFSMPWSTWRRFVAQMRDLEESAA